MTWYKKSENLRGESHDEESSYLWSAVLVTAGLADHCSVTTGGNVEVIQE